MDWSRLIESAPNVAALLAVVGMFLRYLNRRDAVRDEVLRDISEACHANQREATGAIKDNTAALGEMRVTLAKLNGRS